LCTEWVFEPCCNHYHFGRPAFFSQGWLPSPKDPTLTCRILALHPSLEYFRLFCRLLPRCLGRWNLLTQHTEFNVSHMLFKCSSSRHTSIREGCFITKTSCIPVLLSVLCFYLLSLPILCFVYFPILDLPYPLLIGHLVSFMLS